MMRVVWISALVGCICMVCVAGADDWRIEAGPVEISPGDSPQVSGVFHVHAPAGTPADAAPRAGGACLLADLLPFGIGLPICATNADCNTPKAIDKAGNPALENFQGYCTARDRSIEPPRCWTRPGLSETHCLRSRDGLLLTPGTHHLPPVPADPLGRGVPLPDWAVLACIAQESQPGACGAPASEHRHISVTPHPGAPD